MGLTHPQGRHRKRIHSCAWGPPKSGAGFRPYKANNCVHLNENPRHGRLVNRKEMQDDIPPALTFHVLLRNANKSTYVNTGLPLAPKAVGSRGDTLARLQLGLHGSPFPRIPLSQTPWPATVLTQLPLLQAPSSQSTGGVGIFLKHCFKAGNMIYLSRTRCRLGNLCECKAFSFPSESPR